MLQINDLKMALQICPKQNTVPSKLDKLKLCISNVSKHNKMSAYGTFMTHLGSHDVAEKPYTGTTHSIIFIQGNSSIQMTSTSIDRSCVLFLPLSEGTCSREENNLLSVFYLQC
jgi:hypothetical protein